MPLTPTTTRLIAEWHFARETAAQPGFDAAAEMNQRGIAAPAFTRGTLTPEDYEIAAFLRWILAEMDTAP